MKNNQLRRTLCVLLIAASFMLPTVSRAQSSSEPTAKQLEALDKVMAPYRKKVNDVLAADKTGQAKTYQADLQALAKAPREKRDELEASLQRNHYEFIQKTYQRAVINHEEMYRSVANILGSASFTIGEFGSIDILLNVPAIVLPRPEGELHCPFTAKLAETNVNSISGCAVSLEDCSAFLHSSAIFAGGCRSKGSIGGKFELPAGTFQQIALSAQFDVFYDEFAFALGGYSQVTAKIGLRLQSAGVDKKLIVREQTCLSPLLWYNRIKFDASDFSAQGVFSGSFNGNNAFNAQAYYETFAVGALNSGSDVFIIADNYDFIRYSATSNN